MGWGLCFAVRFCVCPPMAGGRHWLLWLCKDIDESFKSRSQLPVDLAVCMPSHVCWPTLFDAWPVLECPATSASAIACYSCTVTAGCKSSVVALYAGWELGVPPVAWRPDPLDWGWGGKCHFCPENLLCQRWLEVWTLAMWRLDLGGDPESAQ